MTPGRTIFQGEFGEIFIPDLLTFLDMLGKTGTLEVRRPDETKRIFWDKGEIVFAESDRTDEELADYLCRNGWVSHAALAEARKQAGNDAVVRHLITSGALEPALLPRALKSLVVDIVYSIFEWKDGVFRFLLTAEPHGEKVVLRTSVSNIIMEGSRRLDELKRIRETFTSDDLYILRADNEGVATVKLPPIEQEVLAFVDGRSTVRDIVRQVEHDQFTVLNALLTLINAGLVGLSPTPAGVPAGDLDDNEQRGSHAILAAFNNIFAGIRERIAREKGNEGLARFESTLLKASFQRSGILTGVTFSADGRVPVEAVLRNLETIPGEERLSRLKGTLDRLLAQQVVQLGSRSPEEKMAITELIAREKARIATIDQRA